MIKRLFFFCVFLFLLGTVAGGIFLVWGYHYITRDLPQLVRIEDYQPPSVSQVFSRDGVLIGEFFEERRYPATIDEIPVMVRNAFLAAEDAKFYSHPGIDVVSIFRAFVKNLKTGSARQGGSTITQQVVKNLLLTSQKKITRKLKEAILAYRIEQKLSKDEILQIYLNQIFFGNKAYGIRAAAKNYYHKELSELTVAEAALLAGLPKAPSRYSPIANFELAKGRQRYVLGQMVEAGFITPQEANAAEAEELKVYKGYVNTIFNAPYYITEIRRIFRERFPNLDLDRDGYIIDTAVDIEANTLALRALRKGIDRVDKRRGWRGAKDFIAQADPEEFYKKYKHERFIEEDLYDKHPALVTGIQGDRLQVVLGDGSWGIVRLSESSWANRQLVKDEEIISRRLSSVLRIGDVVEVSLQEIAYTHEKGRRLRFDQTPDLEGALVLIDPASGEVRALAGGYDYHRSQFNRVTQSYRQPGSAFKPVVYLAAVDGFKYSPASIVYDEARTFKVGEDVWTPGNFDDDFLGPITLRSALEKSRNLVSADIISRIGIESAIHYARKLGIESSLGVNLSLSLGSSEVTLLELVRAYGVFANEGVLLPSVFITRIRDRYGNEIFSAESEKLEKATRVIDPTVAFVMANLMKGVVERGTGWRIRELGRPAAGKTGTSNDLMDAWYVGYTPEWVCGVWVGFDVKKTMGEKETGGRVSSPIWLEFMKAFLDRDEERQYQELVESVRKESELLSIAYEAPERPKAPDFIPPEGVVGAWVNQYSGEGSVPDDPNALYDYFVEGTQPSVGGNYEETTNYLEIPEL